MKERPILFNAEMVRAVLDGSKTQTRRVIKPQPYIDKSGNFCWNGSNFGQNERGEPCSYSLASQLPSSRTKRVLCPFGKVGDRLWVRETWNWFDPAEIPPERAGKRAPFTGCQGSRTIAWHAAYAADGAINHPSDGMPALWRPSIHMPRWASRITLEITAVRVERLQDISEADAKAEGVTPNEVRQYFLYGLNSEQTAAVYKRAAVNPYRELWQSIYGQESWDSNPWVWVVEFKKLEQAA